MATITIEREEIITDFELETVQNLSNDIRTATAAQIAGINKRTMETRIARMKAKYGVKTIHGLCMKFYKNGWIK